MTFYDYYADYIADEEEKVYSKEHIDSFMMGIRALYEAYGASYRRECKKQGIIPEHIYL